MSSGATEKVRPNIGNLSGRWEGDYQSNRVPEATRVTLVFQQLTRAELEQSGRRMDGIDDTSEAVVGTYKSTDGAIGILQGAISGNDVKLTATQITPTCPGSFTMTGSLNGQTFSWTFEGQDCLGDEQGQGTASREGASLE